METLRQRWYDEVERLTTRLVRINSVSPSVTGENACAEEIRRVLQDHGVTSDKWRMRVDGRRIIWGLIEEGPGGKREIGVGASPQERSAELPSVTRNTLA